MKDYQIIFCALLTITKCSSKPYPDLIDQPDHKKGSPAPYKYNIEFLDKSEKGGYGYKLEVTGDDVSQHSIWNNQEQSTSQPQKEGAGQLYDVPQNYHTIQEDSHYQPQIPQQVVQVLPNSYANQLGEHLGPQVFLESMAGKINHGQVPQDSYQPNYVPSQSTYQEPNFAFPQTAHQQTDHQFEALQSADQSQPAVKYYPQFMFASQNELPKLAKHLESNPVSYNAYQQDFGQHNSQDLVQKYQQTIQHDSYSNQQDASNVEDNTKLYSQIQNQYYNNQIPQEHKDGLLLAPLIAHKQMEHNIPKSDQEKPLEYTNQAEYQSIPNIEYFPELKNYVYQQNQQPQVFAAPYKLPDLPKSRKLFHQKPESQVFESKFMQYIPETIKQQETNVEYQALPNRLEHNYVIQKLNLENQFDEGSVKIVPAKQLKFMRPLNSGKQQSQPTQQNIVRHQPQKLVQQQEFVLQYDPGHQQLSHVSKQPQKYNYQPRRQPQYHPVKYQEQQSQINSVVSNIPKKIVNYRYKQEEVVPYVPAQEEKFKTFEHLQQNTKGAPLVEFQMLPQPQLVNKLPMRNINLQPLQQHISASHPSQKITAPFAQNNLFSGGNLGYFNRGANNPDLFGIASQISAQQLPNLGGFNLGTMRRSFKNVTTKPKQKNYRGKTKFVPDQIMIH